MGAHSKLSELDLFMMGYTIPPNSALWWQGTPQNVLCMYMRSSETFLSKADGPILQGDSCPPGRMLSCGVPLTAELPLLPHRQEGAENWWSTEYRAFILIWSQSLPALDLSEPL